jgi:NifB/MoaA-like Fe-S oxidoreductase
VGAIEGWQRELRPVLGTRFAFAADELYLQAGLPLPPARAYEGFAIAEDGVGLVRRFDDAFRRGLARLPARLARRRTVTVVTGEMFAPHLRRLLGGVLVENLEVDLAPIANEWFGRGIGVAGLLTGQDIQSQLAGRALGDEVLLPAVTLRDGAGVFLDDLTPADLAGALGTPVRAVEPTAPGLLGALVGR